MSVEYYNSQIAQNQQAIAAYQREISDCENKVNELVAMKGRVASLSADLSSMADREYAKASAISTCRGIVTAFIKSSFLSNLLDAIKGSDYSAAQSGLEQSQNTIQNKINELRNKIEQNQEEIRRCYSRISSLESERAAFQAAEAKKAAEAAAKASEA